MSSHSKKSASQKKYLLKYSFLLLCSVVIISFLFYNFYLIIQQEFIDEVRHYVKNLSASIATNINVEELKQIKTSEDAGKPVYKKLQNQLYRYKNDFDDIKYIYIMRRSTKSNAKQSDMEYVVDLPVEDENNDGIIDESEKTEMPTTAYDASTLPAMINAWSRPDADKDVAPDPPYPDLLSGYAPIKDVDGKTHAIVGIDITADAITTKLTAVRNAIILYAVFIIFLISLILILLARFQLATEDVKLINKKLTRTMSLRDKFSKMIIHDLRNPLAYILGISNLYKDSDDESPEEISEVFEQIENQAVRMNNLMEDMLFLAKSEHGELILNRQLYDMKNIVLDAVENNKSFTDIAKIELITELPVESKDFLIDKDLFMRVFDNLISNAIKYSQEPDPVIINLKYVSENNGKFEIRVIDRGPGIPKEKTEEIFDLFKSEKKDFSSLSSFGLGLAFCKMVVEAHNGNIVVENNQPHGSVFLIKI